MVLKLIRYKAVSPRHKVGREFSQQGVFTETHVEAPKGLSNTLTSEPTEPQGRVNRRDWAGSPSSE